MIKDGGDLPESCLLLLFNCMLANCFPESLSVGLINAVHKSGDNFDMSNHRGITVGSVFAQLFAMILWQRLSAWAKSHTVKGAGRIQKRLSYNQ